MLFGTRGAFWGGGAFTTTTIHYTKPEVLTTSFPENMVCPFQYQMVKSIKVRKSVSQHHKCSGTQSTRSCQNSVNFSKALKMIHNLIWVLIHTSNKMYPEKYKYSPNNNGLTRSPSSL